MRMIKILAALVGIYIALGLILDGAIGHFQPTGGNTAVLRTFDDVGKPHDRVLGLLNDEGQLWVESGHWFRGWYHRAVANPNVELIQGDQVTPYRAVPVDTEEAVATVTRLMGKGTSNRYWVGRLLLLFAPIKPVRLDPSPNQAAGRGMPVSPRLQLEAG